MRCRISSSPHDRGPSRALPPRCNAPLNAHSADTPAARGEGERAVNSSQGRGFCHAETGALLAGEAAWERRELEEKANRDGPKKAGALAEWTKWQPRAIQPCLQTNCRGISDSLVIGSAIREHGTKLGDSSVGVDFNLSGDPRVAAIERRTVDLIDAVEATSGENPSSKIARLKALATTGVEASSVQAIKAATQSGRRATRFVTCRRLVDPALRAEALHATLAARLDGCPSRDPKTTRRRVAPRSKTGARLTPPIFSPRHAGRATAPDAAACRRPPVGPADRLDGDPPATDSTPLRRSPSCSHKRLETSRLRSAFPSRTKPPNAAAPEHPRIYAFRPPPNPLHRTPRRIATKPNSP